MIFEDITLRSLKIASWMIRESIELDPIPIDKMAIDRAKRRCALA